MRWHQSDRYFGKAKTRATRTGGQVGRADQAGAAAHGGPLRQHHGDLGAAGETLKEPSIAPVAHGDRILAVGLRLRGDPVRDIAQIAARAERRPGRADGQHPHGGVGLGLAQRVFQTLDHFRAQWIARLGPIQDDVENRAVPASQQRRIRRVVRLRQIHGYRSFSAPQRPEPPVE
ncbi:hypothetical protein D9M68_568370 [compost metagenome]